MGIVKIESITIEKEYKQNKVRNLRILYTNADGLLNERQDLNQLLINSQSKKPDIIAITEFKPQNFIHLLLISEFNLDGYNIFTRGLEHCNGRGNGNWFQVGVHICDLLTVLI